MHIQGLNLPNNLDVSMLNEEYHKELANQIEGMKALARKLEPLLPILTTGKLYQYSDVEKAKLNSVLFRSLRFALIPGNDVAFYRCLKSVPSDFLLPTTIDYKEPYVFVPLIGELLAHLWKFNDNTLICEALKIALAQLDILSEHDQIIFESRLVLNIIEHKAVYMQHPYKVNFTILPITNEKLPYDFQVSRVEF